jgi:hypothetical protein
LQASFNTPKYSSAKVDATPLNSCVSDPHFQKYHPYPTVRNSWRTKVGRPEAVSFEKNNGRRMACVVCDESGRKKRGLTRGERASGGKRSLAKELAAKT